MDFRPSIELLREVTLGGVPRAAKGTVVVDNFFMFDNRLVKVEGHSAGIQAIDPRSNGFQERWLGLLSTGGPGLLGKRVSAR